MKTDVRKYKKSDETRRRIFDAAMAVMGERGYQGATVREICERAGVAVGSFYRYFSAKPDILQGVYASGDALMQEEDAALQCLPWLERIEAFIAKYARLNADTGLSTMRILYNPENTWFARTRPMQRKLESLIAGAQAAGELLPEPRAEEMTEILFVCMRGVCYDWCVSDGAYDLTERMIRHMERLLWAFRPVRERKPAEEI